MALLVYPQEVPLWALVAWGTHTVRTERGYVKRLLRYATYVVGTLTARYLVIILSHGRVTTSCHYPRVGMSMT